MSFGNHQPKGIGSDGRGYFAYLPAIFLQNDPTFSKTLELEMAFTKVDHQYYIFENSDGARFNKFFPGIAVLQLPFFGIACLIEWCSGNAVTGYSNTFTNLFYIGHLIYAILGFFMFRSCIRMLFPDVKWLNYVLIALICGTTLMFYSIETSLSHSYSFFLYGVFSWLVLKLKKQFSIKHVVFIGIILGLIALTRPTNLIVVLIIPFLLGSMKETAVFFNHLFRNKAKLFFIGVLSFLTVLSIQLFIWKWQSGSWFFWAYNGEGLNWTKPMIWQTLFSFRTGLFVHTPLLLVSLIGWLILFKKNQFAAAFWMVYFVLNIYVISCWWCWDYETPFGHRPFTEHLFFILIPLFYVVSWKPKLSLLIVGAFTCISLVRYFEYTSGYMTNQRFTQSNYFRSLAFWNSWNFDRWAFTTSCPPFGKVISEVEIANNPETMSFDSTTEYGLTYEVDLTENHLDSRYFVKVNLEKQINGEFLNDVFLVKDAYSTKTGKRMYLALPLYNDRFEGKENWVELELAEAIPDNFSEYNKLKIYIWNKGRQSFQIKNFKAQIQLYKGK